MNNVFGQDAGLRSERQCLIAVLSGVIFLPCAARRRVIRMEDTQSLSIASWITPGLN